MQNQRSSSPVKIERSAHLDESFLVSSAGVGDRIGAVPGEELDGRVRVDAVLGGEGTVDFAVRVGDFGDDALRREQRLGIYKVRFQMQ